MAIARRSEDVARRTIFTTGEVARIANVAPRTVSGWFDSGRLRGYRIPGSRDRRIPREHLVRFLTENGMPLGPLANQGVHVMIFGGEDSLPQELRDATDDGYTISQHVSEFSVGMSFSEFAPSCVIVDTVVGAHLAQRLIQEIRAIRNEVVVIGLTDDHRVAAELGCDEVFRRPFDVGLLATRISSLLSRKRSSVR